MEQSHVHPKPPGCRCSYVTATASLELQCHFWAQNKAGGRHVGTKNHQKVDDGQFLAHREALELQWSPWKFRGWNKNDTLTSLSWLPVQLCPALGTFDAHHKQCYFLFLKQSVSIWAILSSRAACSEQHSYPNRKHTGISVKVWLLR